MPEGAVSVYLQDFSLSVESLYRSKLPAVEIEVVEQDMYNVAPLYLLWEAIRDLKADDPRATRAWLDRAVKGALEDVEDHDDDSCAMEFPDDMNGCVNSCLCPKRTSVNILTRQVRQGASSIFWESQVMGSKETVIQTELATLIKNGLLSQKLVNRLLNERVSRRSVLPKEESAD